MIILKIQNETFLLQSKKPLSIKDKDLIESYCKYFLEDNADSMPELAELSAFDLLEALLILFNVEHSIELVTVPIDMQINIE